MGRKEIVSTLAGNTFILTKSELPEVFTLPRGCVFESEMTAQSAKRCGRHKCMTGLRFKPCMFQCNCDEWIMDGFSNVCVCSFVLFRLFFTQRFLFKTLDSIFRVANIAVQ